MPRQRSITIYAEDENEFSKVKNNKIYNEYRNMKKKLILTKQKLLNLKIQMMKIII